MGIIGWIIIGALAGWIASIDNRQIIKNGRRQKHTVRHCRRFPRRLIMNLLGGYGVTGFNLWSLLVATGGAVVLLLIVNAVSAGRKEK